MTSIESFFHLIPGAYKECNCGHILKNHRESNVGCFGSTIKCIGKGHEWCICNNFCDIKDCDDRMHFGCKIKKELEFSKK